MSLFPQINLRGLCNTLSRLVIHILFDSCYYLTGVCFFVGRVEMQDMAHVLLGLLFSKRYQLCCVKLNAK